MRMKIMILAALLVLACCFAALAASTSGTVVEQVSSRPLLLTYSWSTNSTDQDVNATTAGAYSADEVVVWVVPDSTSVPAGAYDIQLTDSRGLDLLVGAGLNQSNSTAANMNATLPLADSRLTLQVTNAGFSAAGIAYVWLK